MVPWPSKSSVPDVVATKKVDWRRHCGNAVALVIGPEEKHDVRNEVVVPRWQRLDVMPWPERKRDGFFLLGRYADPCYFEQVEALCAFTDCRVCDRCPAEEGGRPSRHARRRGWSSPYLRRFRPQREPTAESKSESARGTNLSLLSFSGDSESYLFSSRSAVATRSC